MRVGRILLTILFVALVVGAALGVIFWPLMDYERAMGDDRKFHIWLVEWVVFDVLLTVFLCRQEIRSLFRGKGVGQP
jgi:hypothetical protein